MTARVQHVIVSLVIASSLAGVSAAAVPLAFEENRGQVDADARFVARGRGYTAFLTPTGAVLSLRDRRSVVRLVPVDGRPAPRVVGQGMLPGIVNYLRADR